jgi:hypothetical protein
MKRRDADSLRDREESKSRSTGVEQHHFASTFSIEVTL